MRRKVLAILFAIIAGTVVLAPSASAAPTVLPVSGVVKCVDGQQVVGVYVESSNGGRNFAGFTRFPTDQSAAIYSISLPSNSGKTDISLNVGCGLKPGTTNQWATSNRTPTKTVHLRATEPIWMNADCRVGGTTRCDWPNQPGLWANAQAGANPAPGSPPGTSGHWCTWGAANRWREMTDVWPTWGGDAVVWGPNASAQGYTVWTDLPRLGAIVTVPSSDSAGHVGQVRGIRFSGDQIIMSWWDVNGRVPGGEWSGDKVWGPGMQVIVPPIVFEGDANLDGLIDLRDFSAFSSGFGGTDWRLDYNDDGKVTIVDFSLFQTWYG